jgi:hypothetical protein
MPAAPFTTLPGVCREEAINLLRRFYLQENPHAPDAKKKMRRGLKLLELPEGPVLPDSVSALAQRRPSATGASADVSLGDSDKRGASLGEGAKTAHAQTPPSASSVADEANAQPPTKAPRMMDAQ